MEILTEKTKSPLLKRAFAMGSRLLDLKIFIQAIKTSADLEYFKTMYGIETEIEKEY